MNGRLKKIWSLTYDLKKGKKRGMEIRELYIHDITHDG